MTPEQTKLILKCRELMVELPQQEPELWDSWHHGDWVDEMTHGPRYSCGHWFGPQREANRMRYRRAIDALEADGLLTMWRSNGTRLSHVKLTLSGLSLAEKLAAVALPANQDD